MSKLQHWTTAELLKLVEAGMLSPEDRFELIDGEIVPVVPQGRRHEVLSDAVEDRLRVLAGVDVHLACRRQFNLAEDTFVKPDMIVCPAAIRTYDLRADQALLVIEIGASSLIFDLGTKARLYAAFGVPEYWVIDAERLATTVHRDPTPDGYTSRRVLDAGEAAQCIRVPAMVLQLTELDLD